MTKKTLRKILAFGIALIFLTAVLIFAVLRPYFKMLSNSELNELIIVIGIAVLVAVILSIIISIAVSKSIIKPIEKMVTQLDNIENIETEPELQPFVNALREQKEKQLSLDKQKKQFTANVSHELKTPLTSIAGYAELIETGIAKEPDIKPFAGTIRKQALRLVNLSEDIIKLSQLDENDDEDIAFSSVNLYETAKKCVDALSINATAKNISIRLEGESIYIKSNPSLLEELIYNLCDNAIRYNRDGGTVEVKISSENEQAVLTVSDTGIGIEEKYQERIFERFFRVDKSRSKATGGTGLGLAIVKHIAQIHDAQIKVSSILDKGTDISIFFQK